MAINSKIGKPVAPAGMDKMKESEKPFSKWNFLMMAGCIILIIVGFLLISGGGSENGEFNPEIFSTRRIVVGPLLAFLGFLLMAFAIIYNPAKKSNINKAAEIKQ